MSPAGTIALPAFFASISFAQTPPHLEFEVASIRPVQIQPDGVNVGLRIDGSQFRISAMTLKETVAIAYRVKISQVTGPDGLRTNGTSSQALSRRVAQGMCWKCSTRF